MNLLQISFGVILRDPPPLPHWQSIVYPYTGIVWAAVVGAVILATFAYYFINNTGGHRLSLTESFLLVVQVRRTVLVSK